MFRRAGFFVIRSALLPVEHPIPETHGPALVEALLSDALVRIAIETASPSLAKMQGRERRDDAEHAMVRYVERMRWRPTPFAVLAGYTTVTATNDGPPGVHLAGREAYAHIARLDVETVGSIVRQDARARFEQVRWTVKRDLVVFDDVVYVTKRGADESLTYDEVARSRALDALLQAARAPRTVAELTAALPDGSPAARLRYVERLVELEVLVPALAPALMTEDELAPLVAVPGAQPLLSLAREARRTPLARDRTAHDALVAELRSFVDTAPLIHDLIKPAISAGLREDDERALLDVANMLARLGTSRAPDRRLSELSAQFDRRYEGRVVRLVDALDPDRGWDFPAVSDEASEGEAASWRAMSVLVNERLRDRALDEIALTDADLAGVMAAPPPPTSSALVCKLAFDAEGKLEIWEPWLAAPPGTNLFARATGIDDELRDLTRAWLREADALEGADVVVADLAYFVIGKTAAFSQYPPLYGAELTLASATESPESIDVNDVLLAKRGGSFVLLHGPTRREIRLRRTSAIVYGREDTTSVVRFLDALARTHASSRAWLRTERAPFAPRVRWRGHVLAAARWRLDEADVTRLKAAQRSGEIAPVLDEVRRRTGLPRHVLYEEDGVDQALHVDLGNLASTTAWLRIVRSPAQLKESFPAERSAVVGPEGHFVHEAVFPLLRTTTDERTAPRAVGAQIQPSEIDRVHPGGPWLYVEIYGHRRDLHAVLLQLIDEALDPASASDEFASWFFLPYSDPEPHLRLRIRGEPTWLLATMLPRLREVLVPMAAVRELAIRTYERETYRYGGRRGMDQTERVWAESSRRVALILGDLDDVLELDEQALVRTLVELHRWLLAATGLPAARCRAIGALAFSRYCRAPEPLDVRRRGSQLHRELRADLAGEPVAADAALAAVLSSIASEVEKGAITRALDELLVDYLHTQSIRLTTTWHPLLDIEALAYVVLEKTFASKMARTP